jgi:CubicO group peptidase (beta-lactamase class C family)
MMRTRHILFMLLVILFSFAGIGVGAQPDDWQTQFEQIIHDEMAYYNIPGAAVAVISGGEVIYAEGFGVRSVESGAPFTPETLFRVGSTTKSMTALLIAQLVDEGALSWDTPVTDLFPTFATADPALTDQILVRDLLGMATGLVSTQLDAFDWGTWTLQDLLGVISRQSIDGEFRNSHNYNNEVYALAGYASAVASGLEPTLDSYRTLMQQHIFDPIGMDSAIITDNHAELGDNYAEPYEPNLLGAEDDLAQMIDPPIALVTPAGGVWVSINDMAKYVITQMNGGVTPDGARIVSAESLAVTWQPGASMNYPMQGVEDVRYAMGWVTQTYKAVPMRWHNGGWTGYATQMAILPESDAAILVFSNSSLGGQFNDALVYSFVELWHGLEVEAAPAARALYAPVIAQLNQFREIVQGDIDADAAERYTGMYEGDWKVEYRDDASLWLTHGEWWSFRLVFVPPLGTYFVINNGGLGAQVDFNTLTEPHSFSIRVGEATQFTFDRVE